MDYDTLDDCDARGDVRGGVRESIPIMMIDMFGNINIKVAVFLFVYMVFAFSDVFVDMFIPPEYIKNGLPDESGQMLQIASTVIAYIVLDLLVKGEFL